ncbi:hypothetical protein [Cellulomonas sp. URHB0016]
MTRHAGFVLYPLPVPRTSTPLPDCVDVAVQAFDAARSAFDGGALDAAADGFRQAADAFRGCVPEHPALRTVCYGNALLALVGSGDVAGARALASALRSADPDCGPAVGDLLGTLLPAAGP